MPVYDYPTYMVRGSPLALSETNLLNHSLSLSYYYMVTNYLNLAALLDGVW